MRAIPAAELKAAGYCCRKKKQQGLVQLILKMQGLALKELAAAGLPLSNLKMLDLQQQLKDAGLARRT